MSAGWEEALDAFGARLADQRAALAAGDAIDIPPFAPPPSLGAFPRHLRDRAEVLLQVAAEVEAQLEAALAATAREAQVVRRLVGAAPTSGSPRFFDRSL
jgi:hypothetical protein